MTPIVSLFSLTPAELRADPALLDAARRMGLNAEMQVFHNPANSGLDTYEKWEAQFEELVGTQIDWCFTNRFRFIARMDDWGRSFSERPWWKTCGWAEKAIAYLAHELWDSGCCDGVEMIDETGADPAVYDAERFVKVWRANGGPPISWPTLNPQRWLVPELSDYASIQWYWPKCKNGGERLETIEARLNAIQAGWEKCLMLDVSGTFYRKRFAGLGGDEYTGLDRLVNASHFDTLIDNRIPPSPKNIAKQFALAARHSVNRIRCYQYDAPHVRRGRSEAKIGERCETGVKFPSPEWDAIAKAVGEMRQLPSAAGDG